MYFWGEKMLSNLFRTLLDSNPQPSDRQADALNSQLVENKDFRENVKKGLPPGLPQILNKWPELEMILKKWPGLPPNIREAICSLVNVPAQPDK